MSRNKHVATLAALCTLFLAGCSSTEVKYPKDYSETLFKDVETFAGEKGETIVENSKKDYYETVLSTNTAYANALNRILLAISTKAHNATGHNPGTNVSNILDDVNADTSIYGMNDEEAKAAGTNNLKNRAWNTMMSSARSGSYTDDNLFYESRFIRSLQEAFTLGNTEANPRFVNGVLITPFMTEADVFDTTSAQYDYYFRNSLFEDTQLSYLTSEYIYEKSYSSIGATNARTVQVAALEERSDKPNFAKKLLNAYIRDYVKGTGTDKSLVGTDKDFSVLSKLWKGIDEADVINRMTDSEEERTSLKERYASVLLTDSERQWLFANGLISTDDGTAEGAVNEVGSLTGKVLDDKKKIEEGVEDLNKMDTSLYSSYTGSYTYDVDTGIRKAIDDIATKSLVTRGTYLKSDGLSSLPTTLKDRIFDSTMVTDKTDLETMKKTENLDKVTEDALTTFEADGFRYVVNPQAQNSDDNLLYYDASSSTYYLVRVLDVASTSSLNKENADSMYTAAQKELLARRVAYAMSSTSTYKTDSYIYWLRRTNIKYSDEGFLEYMKSNYKDLFKTESSVDSEDRIDISDVDFANIF